MSGRPEILCDCPRCPCHQPVLAGALDRLCDGCRLGTRCRELQALEAEAFAPGEPAVELKTAEAQARPVCPPHVFALLPLPLHCNSCGRTWGELARAEGLS